MIRRAVVALVLAAGIGACSDDGPRAPMTTSTTTTTEVAIRTGVRFGTISVDGRDRAYRVYVPDPLPSGPVPLLLGFHGGTGWADQFAISNRIEPIADREGFVVVHPDGVKIGGGPGGVWNGGVCCGPAARQGVDDVAFVDALLDALEAELPIDPARVYAFGHSNGGIMSYRLACELADRIVGIGVVAGTLGVEECAPSQPVAVLHVHGTADENLPIDGGVGPRSVAAVDFPSPRQGFARLEATQGDAADMVFTELPGAPHSWPREPYDATEELVAFLLAHSR